MRVRDQIGNIHTLDHTPQRIVSLVPSQTELLVSLGVKEHIVGITKFCVHPKNMRKEKIIVGGTKTVHYDKIVQLEPDIIFCNKEENTKEMVAHLQKICPVHVSDVITLQDAYTLIEHYGSILNREATAAALIKKIKEQQSSLKQYLEITAISKKRVGYFIWQDPLMVAGGNTFINHLLEEMSFTNPFLSSEGRYPMVTWSDLEALDYIFLSSEPYPFKEKHIKAFSKKTKAQVVLVNGEYFSWYGSRLVQAFPYFTSLIKNLEL